MLRAAALALLTWSCTAAARATSGRVRGRTCACLPSAPDAVLPEVRRLLDELR